MANGYAKYLGASSGGGGGGSGTVTSVSVNTSNGFAGSVADSTTTPAITLRTTVTGILQGNGTAISAATIGDLTDAGTDGIVVTNGIDVVLGSGTSIAQHVADSTHNGYLSSTDWSTFNSKQDPITTGDLTAEGTDGIIISDGTGAVIGSGTAIEQHIADSTHNGYLSLIDWNTFNDKQDAGNFITDLTGDVTASGPGSAAATLATVNANVGSFGSSTAIPNFTVNAKGLVTAAGTNVVIAPAGTLSGTTLAANVVTSSLTSVGTITSGTWNGTVIDIAHGGTNNGSLAVTAGGVLYTDGSKLVNVGAGTSGQVLKSNAGSAPTWGTNSITLTVPTVQRFTSSAQAGKGTFFVTSANATVGATYTNNGATFTVDATISAGTVLFVSTGGGTPTASGTLTKSGGTGDATITFQSFNSGYQTYTLPTSPAPLYIRIEMVGGGGGASGSGVGGSPGAGSDGGGSAFGTSLLVTTGGKGALASAGTIGGLGGTASLGTGPIGTALNGGNGNGGYGAAVGGNAAGGMGGVTPFGGAGGGASGDGGTRAGIAAVANTGSGGGGASAGAQVSGGGGGASGYVDAIIGSPSSTYIYSVGGGGTGGTAGTSGQAGGAGGSGVIIVTEYYQ